MKIVARIIIGLALAGLIQSAVAQWQRVDSTGEQICRRETGETFATGYASKSYATAFCNTLNKVETYLTAPLAEAQTLTLLRGVLPTGGAVPTNPPQALSSPWLQTDIGTVPFAGNAFDLANVLQITGSGDINNDADNGHQVYQEFSGDYEVVARVDSLVGDNIYRKIGVSIRDDDTEEDSRYCWMMYYPGLGLPSFQYKTNPTDFFDDHVEGSAISLPYYFRVVLSAGVCSGYVGATAATATTLIGSAPIAFSGTKFYGATVSSGSPVEALATGVMTLPTLTSVAGNTGTLQFTVATQSQAENVTPLTIVVSRAGGTSGAASVQVANAGGGSAVAGTDFTNVFPATLNWTNGDGSTEGQNVTIINRSGTQGSRTLNLTLTGVTGATLGAQSTQTVTLTDAATGSGIKYHPGFYANYYPGGTGYAGSWFDQPAVLAEAIDFINDAVCPYSNIKGVQFFMTWASLEGDVKGQYSAGITRIQSILNALGACSSGHKHLILEVTLAYFQGTGSQLGPWPAYLVQPGFPGGTDVAGDYGLSFGTSQDVTYARVWEVPTVDAWLDLNAAYAAAFDTNPYFEMIGTGLEGSFGMSEGTDGFTYAGVETQLTRALPIMRTQWAHTAIHQGENYTLGDDRAVRVQQLAAANGITVGGPDTIPHEDIQANRVYVGELGGVDYSIGPVFPWLAQLEDPELCGGKDSRPGGPDYTYSDMYNHVMNGNPSAGIGDVDASYFAWIVIHDGYPCSTANQQWSAGGIYNNWPDGNIGGALDFIQTNPTINSACPTSYASRGGCDTTP